MQIKSLPLFEWLMKVLIRDHEEYIIEHRIFIAASFVGSMAGLFATIINIFLSLHYLLIITTSLMTLVYFLFYFLSVKKRIYKNLIIPYIFISLLTIAFLWFINGGSSGPVSYVFVTALLIYIILTRGTKRITALSVVVITVSLLYLWEYLHPELIINHTNAESKFLDIYFTALFCIGLIAFITSFIVRSYDEERQLVIKQRDKIIEQNLEIKTAENELLQYQQNLENIVKQRTAELEETNRQLLVSKEKAEESDRLKTAFLSNMSHEIRTPMNAILGFAHLLNEPGINKEIMDSYIEIITSKGNSLLKIIDDIIDISKIDANEIEIKKQNCNIDNLINDLQKSFNAVLKTNKKDNIVLKAIIPEKEDDLVIQTDPYRLNQILTNLIDNAIKFTRSGTVEYGYEVETVNHWKKVIFFVKDTGIGISEEKLNIIFTRFRQIDESHTREFGGTGIGLAISKKLVELLGGKLEVESIVGKGSKFYFSIAV
jgi:signal transduction histidine kinase